MQCIVIMILALQLLLDTTACLIPSFEWPTQGWARRREEIFALFGFGNGQDGVLGPAG